MGSLFLVAGFSFFVSMAATFVLHRLFLRYYDIKAAEDIVQQLKNPLD